MALLGWLELLSANTKESIVDQYVIPLVLPPAQQLDLTGVPRAWRYLNRPRSAGTMQEVWIERQMGFARFDVMIARTSTFKAAVERFSGTPRVLQHSWNVSIVAA